MSLRPGQALLRGAAGLAALAVTVNVHSVGASVIARHAVRLRAVGSSSVATHIFNRPDHRRVVNGAEQSTNWSGYAESQTVTSASATWDVPTVATASPTAYSSTWVGVDGYANSDLIQTGTSADSDGSYYAWWEILPAAETRINAPVGPGDAITASVSQVSAGTWQIQLDDQTRGWSFDQDEAYSGPHDSAEWIEEAPTIVSSSGSASVATLADYGTIDFTSVDASGASAALGTDPQASSITLVTDGEPNSVPSTPSSAGNAFATTWQNPSATSSSSPTPSSPTSSGSTTTPNAPVTVPAAPGHVRARRSGSHGATLRWSTPSSGHGVSRWVVRVYNGSHLAGSFRVSGNSIGARFTRLTPGRRYSFSVAAADTAGLGPFSRSNVVVIH